MTDKFYTLDEIAEMLDVSTRTIRNYINAGKLAAYRFGQAYKVQESDLKTFIEKSKVNIENGGN